MNSVAFMRPRFALRPIAALLMAMGIAGTSVAAEPFVVRDIRVEGIQRTEAGTVFSYLPVKVGETFTDEKAAEAIKALYATGFFSDVRLEAENNVLVVTLAERPSIASVAFSGAKEFDAETLKKALREIGLTDGQIFDRSSLDRAEQELKRQYLTRGFYAAQVTATVTPIERNRVAITFNITEGEIAKIRQISLIGLKAFGAKELLGNFRLTTPGWLTWYTKSDQYNKQKLTGDLENLRSFYLNRGYLEFNVESTQVSITPDKKDIYITVNLSEGEKYTVSDVKVVGDTPLPPDQLQALMQLKAGDVYNGERLGESTRQIQERLGAVGYAFANANATPEVNREKREVALTVFIDIGRRVYVRNINVSGNTRTRDEVVRRELRQTESGWFDGDKIRISKERVDRLGYFTEVNVETPAVPNSPDQLDVNFAVTERPTGIFNVGAGFSTAEKLILSTSIQQTNLFGSGNTVGIDVNTSKLYRTVAVSQTTPYFTVDGISRTVDAYYRTITPASISLGDYRIKSRGLGMSFGVPFSEVDTVFFGARYEGTAIELQTTSPLTYVNFVNTFGAQTHALMGTIGWARDSRDSALAPTRGRFQRANAEITTPSGDLRYVRTTYQHTYFYPINRDFTIMGNGEVGIARGFGGRPLPVFKNYYAGGIGSVRGYETSTLGPRDTNGSPIGGATRLNANVELQFPIPGSGLDRTFRGFTFLDAGNVYGENEKISLGELRYSTGLGMAWLSPIGALKVSIAMPLHRQPIDRVQRFQFTIGSGF